MTDDSEVRQALRAMLSDRMDTLTPPSLYETVRTRAIRRRRATVGGALAVALAAVAVPSYALANRPVPAPATDRPAVRQCTLDNAPLRPVPPSRDRLPVQRDVPGALGGDARTVDAVLRVGWAALRADGMVPNSLEARTAKVIMVSRIEGQIVGLVGASGNGRRVIQDAWVWGPDPSRLAAITAGASGAAFPLRKPYPEGEIVLRAVPVCGVWHVVVVAPPGSTGQVTWVGAITPDLRGVRRTIAVPLRADGVAAFRVGWTFPRFRIERAGRVLWDQGYQGAVPDYPWPRPTEAELRAIAARAPGDGDPAVVWSIVERHLNGFGLPVPASDQRVLWTGRSGSRTVAVMASTLPGGVSFVSTASASVPTAWFEGYGGLLAPGALDRTVLAWQADEAGRLWATYAAAGTRAEAVLLSGDTVPFALDGGGGVVSTRYRVVKVRVYGADDVLIGEQVPGRGLAPVPLETGI